MNLVQLSLNQALILVAVTGFTWVAMSVFAGSQSGERDRDENSFDLIDSLTALLDDLL